MSKLTDDKVVHVCSCGWRGRWDHAFAHIVESIHGDGGCRIVEEESPIIVSEEFIQRLIAEDAPASLIAAIRRQNAARASAFQESFGTQDGASEGRDAS